MKIGYARVSTKKQNLDLQIDALQKEGCEKIFSEKISGLKEERPELCSVMDILRPGDHLYVWALDRLGRNIYQIIQTVDDIHKKGVILHFISQKIDTSSTSGKVFLTIFALLADMEIELKKERRQAGIEAAKKRGITGGRPAGLNEQSKKKAQQARTLYLSREPIYSVREIAEMLNVSTRTLYKYLDFLNVPRRGEE